VVAEAEREGAGGLWVVLGQGQGFAEQVGAGDQLFVA